MIVVTFYQDGRCLGPAFRTAVNVGEDIFPVVRANDKGDHFSIQWCPPPAHRTRQAVPIAVDVHPAEGSWILQKLFVGPELGEFPLADNMAGEYVRMKITRSGILPGTFDFSVKVCNNISIQGVSSSDPSLENFEGLNCGEGMSTMMMGPPGMMEVEQQILKGFRVLQKWIAENGFLLLNGPTVEMEFARDAGMDVIDIIELSHAL
jgi:hypothetical protein